MNRIKKILLFSVWLILIDYSNGQAIPSSCIIDSNVKKYFFGDAHELALMQSLKYNVVYIDSMNIKQSTVDTFLSAFAAIYNNKNISARDTVIDILKIHAYNQNELVLYRILINVDSNQNWLKRLRDKYSITNDSIIDSMFSKYHLHVAFDTIIFDDTIVSITLESDSFYNMYALSKEFSKLKGIISTDTYAYFTTNKEITTIITSSYIEFYFKYGWGDCFNGCIKHRIWKFRVYYDCSVEFISSYGNVIDFLGVKKNMEGNNFTIYPNPTSTTFNIQYISQQKEELAIYSILGEKIYSDIWKKDETQKIIEVSKFEKGIYIIKIGNEMRKIIVE